MARTNHVRAYRGRRVCQHTPDADGEMCKMPKNDITHEEGGHHDYDGGTIRCGACDEPIKMGDAYKFKNKKTGPYSSVKLSRHEGCPEWKASELTGSPFLAVMYAADENAPVIGDDGSGLEELRDHYMEAAREMAEIRTEAADNIVDGFGHDTYQSDELRDDGERCESAADSLEYIEIPDFDEVEEAKNDYAGLLEDWESSEPSEPDAGDTTITPEEYEAACEKHDQEYAEWAAEEPDDPDEEVDWASIQTEIDDAWQEVQG